MYCLWLLLQCNTEVVAVTETLSFTKPNVFDIWLFGTNVCWPLSEMAITYISVSAKLQPSFPSLLSAENLVFYLKKRVEKCIGKISHSSNTKYISSFGYYPISPFSVPFWSCWPWWESLERVIYIYCLYFSFFHFIMKSCHHNIFVKPHNDFLATQFIGQL